MFLWPWSRALACARVTLFAVKFVRHKKTPITCRIIARAEVDAAAVDVVVDAIVVAPEAAPTVKNSTHWRSCTWSPVKNQSRIQSELNAISQLRCIRKNA